MRVGLLLDEVFGAENRVTVITYKTTSASSAGTLPDVCSYLLWYAKDRASIKYNQLYESLDRKGIIDLFAWRCYAEMPDGSTRKLSTEEANNPSIIPDEARLFMGRPFKSQGWSDSGRSEPYIYNGRTFTCNETEHWSISHEGIDRLAELGRLDDANGSSETLCWKRYENEVPGKQINNMWQQQMRSLNEKVCSRDSKKCG